jgi:hypothetical protein
MRRPAVAISVLAILGLVAAAGIGLLINAVSGDSIGLAAQPLSAGSLAPPEAGNDKGRGQGRGRGRGGEEVATSRQEQPSQPAVPSDDVVPEAPELNLSDDHGGNSSGSDDLGGGDSANSGSGSDSSGSGSSGSGSSGSGSSGSGSGDD